MILCDSDFKVWHQSLQRGWKSCKVFKVHLQTILFPWHRRFRSQNTFGKCSEWASVPSFEACRRWLKWLKAAAVCFCMILQYPKLLLNSSISNGFKRITISHIISWILLVDWQTEWGSWFMQGSLGITLMMLVQTRQSFYSNLNQSCKTFFLQCGNISLSHLSTVFSMNPVLSPDASFAHLPSSAPSPASISTSISIRMFGLGSSFAWLSQTWNSWKICSPADMTVCLKLSNGCCEC